MANDSNVMWSMNIMTLIAEELGPKLCMACRQDNLAQVKDLTSDMNRGNYAALPLRVKWAALLLAAGLEPAYRFLVESNLVNADHDIERYGQLLGCMAGSSRMKRHSLVKWLLEKNVDPNEIVDMYGARSVLTAAGGFSDQQMVELLLDHGATIGGTGALVFAVGKGNKENVRYLLSRGADVNEIVPVVDSRPGREGMGSALHMAVENGHVAIVDILLNAGADVTLKDAKGRTAADIATTNGMDATTLARLS